LTQKPQNRTDWVQGSRSDLWRAKGAITRPPRGRWRATDAFLSARHFAQVD